MALTVVTNPLPRCARCTGQMYMGHDGEQTCMWCGEIIFPPTPTLQNGEDIDTWRRRLRGKPGRPRRQPPAEATLSA
jgi:hypothetical protein